MVVPSRPEDLPEFDHPPVVEVIIGAQFEPIRQFRQAHIGLFWNEIRADYPVVQDQPRLETPVEPIDWAPIGPSFHIEVLDSPPVQRAWFVSSDDSLLVQVQNDRLIHNWRHRGEGYPRFEPLLERFWSRLDTYEKVIGRADLQMTSVQQIEVTYVNWVLVEAVEKFFRPSSAAQLDVPEIGPLPDAQLWSARYPVRRDGQVIGVLVIEAQPARRVERNQVLAGFQLALTFRAPVTAGATREELSSLLLRGRDAIVRSFTAVTTTEMHQIWGRRS